MVDFIRKQLNELMGEDRNDDIDNSVVTFTAPQHCRYYLCGTFPPPLPPLFLCSLDFSVHLEPVFTLSLVFSRSMSL